MINPPTSNGVALTGEVSLKDNQLVIEYKITNQQKQVIYLWDVMVKYDSDGKEVLDPAGAYVSWEEPATLRVVRAMLELPPDRKIGKKEVPYVHEVKPEETVQGRIVLRLPAVEYSPFYPPPKKVRDLQCNAVRLLIGWSELREGMTFPPRSVGSEKVLAIRGGWKPPMQKLADATFKCPVALQVSEEFFDRRMPMQ